MNIATAIRHIESFAPGFSRRIAGAVRTEIATLEAAAMRPFPLAYLDYLSAMGKDNGGIGEGFGGSGFELERLLSYYEQPPWLAPKPYLVIGLDPGDSPLAFHTLLADVSMSDPPVVLVDFPNGIPHSEFPQAHTLGELMFRYAFSNLLAARFELEASLVLTPADRETLERLARALADLGFAKHPASEGYATYFMQERLLVQIQTPPATQTATLFIHGHERAGMEALIARLHASVSLTIRYFDLKANMFG